MQPRLSATSISPRSEYGWGRKILLGSFAVVLILGSACVVVAV
jgi:hypothetical protein